MKLVRFGPNGAEKPGVLGEDGTVHDATGLVPDWAGDALSDTALSLVRASLGSLPRVPGTPRLGPPVAGVGKFLCVGLNYSDHAAESGMPIPDQPILFMKATTAITGPNDPILIPPGAEKTDWEVELGVVIGRRTVRVPVEQALDHVAGYCVVNDVSERAWQLEQGGQWVKGKSADSFAPLGPWLVTRDAVPDPQALGLWLDVNGERLQTGHSRHMIFGVADLVSRISHYMRLMPGDIISTGTPAGVGLGLTPPRFLRPGDRVELGIDRLGRQAQMCMPA